MVCFYLCVKLSPPTFSLRSEPMDHTKGSCPLTRSDVRGHWVSPALSGDRRARTDILVRAWCQVCVHQGMRELSPWFCTMLASRDSVTVATPPCNPCPEGAAVPAAPLSSPHGASVILNSSYWGRGYSVSLWLLRKTHLLSEMHTT